MRGLCVRIASLAVSLVAFSCCEAFIVTNGPMTPMDPTDTNRVLEQSYNVAQPMMDRLFGSESLQTLKISVPGRVFVSVGFGQMFGTDSGRHLATVRFSGNSEDIFQYFEVVSSAPNTVEVRRRPEVHGRLQNAYMLTEIMISSSHQISEIITAGSADVIVEDLVLVSDGSKALKLQLDGHGNVYLNTMSSRILQSVSVKSSGSGDFKWTMGSLQTQDFELNIAGSGDLTLMGQELVATGITVAIAGSGDLCVDAPRIETNSLFSATVGSGTTSFSSYNGQCVHEDISILGSGDVYLGSMQCKDVKITVAGAGDIYVQAVHSISGTAWGAGDVKYVGVTPELISDRYDANVYSADGATKHKKYHPIAKQKLKNKVTTCRIASFPPRVAVHVTSSFWEGSVGSVSSVVGPLVFFALLSLCYLRRQMKPQRRGRSERRDQPRFVAYPPQSQERQPLMQQQQQQQPQTQVYV